MTTRLELARCLDAAWRFPQLEASIREAQALLERQQANLPAAPTSTSAIPIAGRDVPFPRRTKDAAPRSRARPVEGGASEGVVIVEVRIDLRGRVADASVVRSVPGLDDEALSTARRWEYAVTRINGRPVDVISFGVIRFGGAAEPVPSDWIDLAQFQLESGRPELARIALLTALNHAQADVARYAGFSPGVEAIPGTTDPKLTRQVDPKYTQDAIRLRAAGTVEVEMLIDTRGMPGRLRVLSKASVLDEPSLAAVSQWRFEPARRDGKPVAFRVVAQTEFNLGIRR